MCVWNITNPCNMTGGNSSKQLSELSLLHTIAGVLPLLRSVNTHPAKGMQRDAHAHAHVLYHHTATSQPRKTKLLLFTWSASAIASLTTVGTPPPFCISLPCLRSDRPAVRAVNVTEYGVYTLFPTATESGWVDNETYIQHSRPF